MEKKKLPGLEMHVSSPAVVLVSWVFCCGWTCRGAGAGDVVHGYMSRWLVVVLRVGGGSDMVTWQDGAGGDMVRWGWSSLKVVVVVCAVCAAAAAAVILVVVGHIGVAWDMSREW